MFQVLKSIRESLVSSFKEGVYWRESVITRTDEELHAAATKSVDKQFLPDEVDLESDSIIVALRRVATKENAESPSTTQLKRFDAYENSSKTLR